MNAVVKQTGSQVLRPQSFEQLAQFANMASKSTMVPPNYKGKPEDIMLAVQMGSEVGLAPMQALQNIAVINGRPALWGDAQLGLCKSHPAWVSIEETMIGQGEARAARCVVIRNGEPPVVREFGYAQAKQAGLWGKTGPWTQYPDRMMQMRARGFALRDAFPDALRGLLSEHEARDTPPPVYHGTTIDAVAETARSSDAFPTRPSDPAGVTYETVGITPTAFLDALAAALDAAQTAEAVDAIQAHPRVQKAMDAFQNGHRTRLLTMVGAAVARTAPPENNAPNDDDDFPGDR